MSRGHSRFYKLLLSPLLTFIGSRLSSRSGVTELFFPLLFVYVLAGASKGVLVYLSTVTTESRGASAATRALQDILGNASAWSTVQCASRQHPFVV